MDQPKDWFDVEVDQITLAPIVSGASVTQRLDSLIVPVYVGVISALIFLLQSYKGLLRKVDEDIKEDGERSFFRRRLEIIGGGKIYAFRVAQALDVLALWGISVVELALSLKKDEATPASIPFVVQITHCALYAYLSVLALLSLFGGAHVSFRAYAHGSWVLASLWGAYIYRDVWPLATISLSPVDEAEGALVWVKLALLTVAGVVVPLKVPRKYEPANPEDVLDASPEQTASLWALSTYVFVSPAVWLASRMPHLPYEMLPPLADFDHSKNLVGHSFQYLDPILNKSRVHLGIKLVRVFSVELCHLAAVSIVSVIAAFAVPISINNILIYLESESRDNIPIKPWFWIVLFFVGSLFKSISDAWFVYKAARVNVRMQAVITEVVFEHALRVRMKAETSDDVTCQSDVPTAVPTLDDASQAEDVAVHDGGDNVSEETTTITTSVKGKGKGKDSDMNSATSKNRASVEPVEAKTGARRNLIGRINNLVSSDLSSLDWVSAHAVFTTIKGPIRIVLCMVFLQQILGWSAWVGFATLIATLPIPGIITKGIRNTQREKMERTDARVQLVTEMMNVIRMVKLFGWEPRITAQINEKREEELVSVRKTRILTMWNNLFNFLIPIFIMLATFFTYAVVMKGSLSASKVFSAMSVFEILRSDIAATFYIIPNLIQSIVAIERIGDFLYNTELIGEYAELSVVDTAPFPAAGLVPESRKDSIGIRNASFTWAAHSMQSVPATPGGALLRVFVLSIDDEVLFGRGKVNLIVGPTGAGKTSLLMALLGEMHYLPRGSDSFVSLPRDGGVAYAAQESWVQSDTIKNNIVFGSPFDEVRYNKVIDQCALRHDLSLFDAGDQTEVGEKGITLSGGQKARLTLARAVYSSAEIVLLDDILAALDVHTSRWIVDKCLKGDLLAGRTIILATHNVAMVSPIADFVVGMGSDGHILSKGSLSNALAHDAKLLKELQRESEDMAKVKPELEQEVHEDAKAKRSAGKLVVEEEIEFGHVGLKAVWLFFGNASRQPVAFWTMYVGLWVIRHLLTNIQTWYLGYWATQYETHPPDEVNVAHYLTVYTISVIVGMFFAAACAICFVIGGLRAGKVIHEMLVVSIMRTTLRWLDKTPTSRIIARCTEDIQALDTKIPHNIEQFIQMAVFMLLKMLAVVAFSPVFMGPSIIVAAAGYICGNIFVKAQLSVKREMSKARAPVLGHFGATISGITSVRAYGKQEDFKQESLRRIDCYSRAAITHFNLDRWVVVRLDFIGILYTTALAAYLTYAAYLSASDAGFSLNMAAAFSGTVLQCVRVFNEFEVAGNSLERMQQYLTIEHEPEPTPAGIPPAYWPASGSLSVRNLTARYSPAGSKVLHGVSFEVKAGERVGIVGRTGSGKSSLTLALLRCILTEGQVIYDGLDVGKLNLNALRSSVTIIPQVPELLSGTLRQNLDPFGEHSDATLNAALRSAGLASSQHNADRSRLTLDSAIAGGGANLSVGQRQIVALARALVRGSKLLVLDEATSAVDFETDAAVQAALRTELGRDVTLLTVAHRLQTIMDSDKIMVLDVGSIVEFGKPSELLENEQGKFRALVDESGDREKLYALANAAGLLS